MLGSHEHSLPECDRPCLTIARRWRLWHGRVAPGHGVRRVSVAGCDLVVLGCTPADDAKLRRVAREIAAGQVDAVQRVDGSRVVLAARSDELLIAADLAGQRPVYYPRVSHDGLVAGSHARPLAGSAGLDWDWLVAHLLVPGAADVWWTGTPWQGVNALRPGWTMRIASDGTTTQACRTVLPTPSGTIEDSAPALSEALDNAVRCRVSTAGHPTADFSGGLDSSTLAVLASCLVNELPALTVVTEGVDDADVAARAAQEVPSLRHHVVAEPPALLPYAELDRVPCTDEPWLGAATSARERWWIQQVHAEGSDLHLSGDGGDGVLLATPAYLADLVSPRQGRELWRHAVGWARLRHQAPHALLRAAVALRGTSYGQACRVAADQLVAGTRAGRGWAGLVSWFQIGATAEWATRKGRAVVARMLREHADAYPHASVPGQMGLGDSSAFLALNAFARQQRLDADMAAQWSVNHHAPYLDDGVVRACWAVPAWRRTTPEQAKPLLRHAMYGTVPASVLERRTKGDYTTSAYQGLRANADTLRELIHNSRLAEVGILDRNTMRSALDRGINGHSIRLAAFDAVIGTELWLRANEDGDRERS
ncbi:albusnodin/ikarugamycin family macrolactam cyclase [Actinopolyspora mortivallis]|uniref:albusnodin/ikarugamycin family macrolactam cyclase n=1 Tax=Actinopolyspora mortivallis TaxID=33906 RepID=UPI0003A80B25|nr:albusnodin/ikarugamycin family macrolactam cyclase [Actinopolyspora mortivallis]